MKKFDLPPMDKQRIRVLFADGDWYNGLYDAEDDCVWFGAAAEEAAIDRANLISEAAQWEPLATEKE